MLQQIHIPENPNLFWQNWRNPYRIGYLVALFVFIIVLIAFLLSRWWGTDLAIPIHKTSELEAVPFTLDTFTQGLYNFPVEANNYIITEKFEAQPFQYRTWVTLTWLLITSLSLLVLLTSVTFLPRLYFAVGMTVFIGVLVSFRLENLQLFGFTNQFGLGLALFLFLPTAYFFQEFRRKTPYFQRFAVFLGIGILLTLLIVFFAKANHPVSYLAGYGILAPVFLTLAFIVLVAHENIVGIANITSRSGSKQSFLHFLFLSLAYISNLMLLYLKNRKVIDWNIVYLDAFAVLAISAVVGIWGFRRQSRYFTNVLPFFPQGAIAYLGLGTLSFATIAFFFVTANDPMLEMFEDAILYAHIGLGVMFFFYVAINFLQPFQQGLPVIKIIYEPVRVSTFIMRGVGIIIGVLMFQVAGRLPLFQGQAGYYNHLGDLYLSENEYVIAEDYYKTATTFTGIPENHKSNYALSDLAKAVNREDGAVFHLQHALFKNPLPQTYLALAKIYGEQNKFFDALFTLQDGLKNFPESGELHNNLALLYASKNLTDSANFYLDKAEKYLLQKEFVQSNRLAIALKTKRIPEKLLNDSTVSDNDYLPLKTNKIALQNLAGKTKSSLKPELPKDTLLTKENFAFWFNYALQNRFEKDTFLFRKVKLLEKPAGNFIYEEDLKFARACHEYLTGDKALAFNLLSILQNTTATQPAYFSRMLGLWFSQNGAYQRAVEYFDKAIAKGDTLYDLNRTIAFAEQGNFEIALSILQEKNQKDPTAQSLQNVLQALLDKNRPAAIAKLTDSEKAFFVHFAKDTELVSVVESIENQEFKNFVLLQLAGKYLEKNVLDKAQEIINRVESKDFANKDFTLELNFVKANYRLLNYEKQKSGNLIPVEEFALLNREPFTRNKEVQKLEMRAFYLENSNDLVKAEAFYRQAIQQMPLSEKVILAASRFLSEKRKKPLDAYTILLNSIQLNPYSAELYKAYILQALEISAFTYAEIGLQDLKNLLKPADYQAFVAVYQTKKALIEKERENFR